MSDALSALKDRLGQIADVSHAVSLASWDQQTMMPSHGAQSRAEAMGTLTRVRHELFADDETGRLIESATAELPGDDRDGDDQRLIEVVRRRWEKARRTPPALAADQARAASAGQSAWVEARERSDFGSFVPYLERNLELLRRYIDYHMSGGDYETAYDVVLDDFEPRMRTADVSRLFAELREEIVPVIGRLRGVVGVREVSLDEPFPVDGQRALVREVLGMMGFDATSWRMDDTVHPFATRIGHGDVRITTRWDERWFPMGLYGAMHE